MSAHTPGPWRLDLQKDREGNTIDAFVSAPDVNGFAYRAEILGDDEYRDEEDTGAGIARKIADASLVSAALDLLEALEYFVEWFELGGHQDGFLDQARAAIAKAKGEA